jgi:hypothetical protein
MFKMSSYVSQIPFGIKDVDLSITFSNQEIPRLGISKVMKMPILVCGKNAREPDEINMGDEVLCVFKAFKRNYDFRWNLGRFISACREKLNTKRIAVTVIVSPKGRIAMAA